MSLKEYQEKRNFKETSEPKGKEKTSAGKLRFVVQRHAASRLHYDFRLEMNGVLKSWAVPKGPSLNPSDKRLAMRVEDHPFAYRTFEGTIPEGNYGAGEVEIWDEGTYKALEKGKNQSDSQALAQGLESGSLKIVLEGSKLKGEFALVRIKGQGQQNAWLLIKHKDAFAVDSAYDAEEHTAKDSKVTAFLNQKSSKKKAASAPRKTEAAAKKERTSAPPSAPIKPMLCKTVEDAFDDAGWAFELKWDGYRAIAELSPEGQRLYSRNGVDFSSKFKAVSAGLAQQKQEMVLDGEIVAYDESGKPSFQWLQNAAEHPSGSLVYQVFDLLWLNGFSTRDLPYLQRKELLKQALIETKTIQYHDYILENGRQFYKASAQMGLEGIIAKRIDSPYQDGSRSGDWLKIKHFKSEEAVICGFTEPKGSRKFFGSLILGKYLKGEMVFCGHSGTGFNQESLQQLYHRMEPLITSKAVFQKLPKTNGTPTWIRPELVAEIKFSELTSEHIYRHPVFLRLRDELSPQEVSFEENQLGRQTVEPPRRAKAKPKGKEAGTRRIGKVNLTLTNQQKVFFPGPGITKGDVIEYYQRISGVILPHLKMRPESLNRFPNGIDGMSFFQKDAAPETPDWIPTVEVPSESSEKSVRYLICNDKATLAYLNNLGCIELNVWTSRVTNLLEPDYLVLDLDPSKKNTFSDVVETAWAVKEVLENIKVKGFVKTSGKSGLHIYIPMGSAYSFEQVKDFAHLLMLQVQQRLPNLTTLERSLKKRPENKIYLDYLQNRKGQTLACAYSLRPVENAPVSTPLRWEELNGTIRPADFNIHTIEDRLKDKGDLFKPVLGKGINLLKALSALAQK